MFENRFFSFGVVFFPETRKRRANTWSNVIGHRQVDHEMSF